MCTITVKNDYIENINKHHNRQFWKKPSQPMWIYFLKTPIENRFSPHNDMLYISWHASLDFPLDRYIWWKAKINTQISILYFIWLVFKRTFPSYCTCRRSCLCNTEAVWACRYMTYWYIVGLKPSLIDVSKWKKILKWIMSDPIIYFKAEKVDPFKPFWAHVYTYDLYVNERSVTTLRHCLRRRHTFLRNWGRPFRRTLYPSFE
jgi:hypothetical protein